MSNLTIQRVIFNIDADKWLRILKARTGITPNILCRLGFCLSLEEPGMPSDPFISDKASDRVINRYTILGEYDILFAALLIQWMTDCGGDISSHESVNKIFIAHMNRGVDLLSSRVKSIADIASLIPA